DRRSSARAAKAAQPHLSVHLPRPARGGGARLPPARDALRQGGGGGRCRRGFCPAQESLHARLARRRFQPRGRARRRRRAVITARATNSVLTLPLVGRVGAKRRGGGRALIRTRGRGADRMRGVSNPSNPKALADQPADVAIEAREVLAHAFRPYERVRARRAGDEVEVRDLLRAGPAVAVLPIDLKRGEVVLIRQFRVAAQLANGKGDLVEIVAGHVEPNEAPRDTAQRECHEEIGVAPQLLVELFTY